MGNSNYGESRMLGGWLLTRRDWVERLYRYRRFTQAMGVRWRSLRGAGKREELLRSVDRHVAEIGGAQDRNFQRWPVLGRYVWPNPVDPSTGQVRTTYASEVEFLKSWLERRIDWIDGNIEQLSRRERDR